MIVLSVIVLSYNTKNLLQACLDSLYRYLPRGKFEIIIVDNASTDGSPDMIRKYFPGVTLIVSESNLGFAKGINLGAKAANGEFLLFINSDAQLQDTTIHELLLYMQKHTNIGIAGGLLKDSDGTLQRSYGNFYTLPATIRMLVGGDKGEMKKRIPKKPKLVDWVSGGFMVIRKQVFADVNGFDEKFFMYMEDMELCYRVTKEKYGVAIFPEATAIHIGHGSSNRSFAIQHIYKGLLYFYKKHRAPWEYYVVQFILMSKARLLILIGSLTHNVYLTTTYKQALKG